MRAGQGERGKVAVQARETFIVRATHNLRGQQQNSERGKGKDRQQEGDFSFLGRQEKAQFNEGSTTHLTGKCLLGSNQAPQ
jgi:hypothetical protein